MSIAAVNGPGSLPVQYLWYRAASLSPAVNRLLNLEKEVKPIKEIAGAMQLSSREVQRIILSIESKLKKENSEDGRN